MPADVFGRARAAYSRAILGVYELGRIELLRDVYRWVYTRSTQEYLAIKQGLVEPDPLRLKHRALVKKAIFDIVTQPASDPLMLVKQHSIAAPKTERSQFETLLIDELRRLHDGVLARYGLRPSQLLVWRKSQIY